MVSVAMIEQVLAGIDYPADKQRMIQYAREHNAPREVMDIMNRMPDRQYTSAADVARSVSDVQ